MKATPATQGHPDLTIGNVAARFNLPTHVLRHWEDEGLLTPARDASGYRAYSRRDVVRVAVVVRNRSAGLSLPQIRDMLDGDPSRRHSILQSHLDELDARAAQIEQSRAMTEHAMGCPAHDIIECPRFAAHVADLLDDPTPTP